MDVSSPTDSRDSSPDDATSDTQLEQLERARCLNDQKLKNRFEHIFAKYGHDFSDVGDEIDLRTGEIVVNNGHLECMQNEADPGPSASSRFLRTFQENLEHENDEDSSDGPDGSEAESSASYEDDDESVLDPHQIAHAMDRAAGTESPTLKTEDPQNKHPSGPFGTMTRPAPRLAHLLMGQSAKLPIDLTGAMRDSSSADSDTASAQQLSNTGVIGDMLKRVPNIQNSVNAQTSRARQGADVNDSTIQALGASIANQLASLMSLGSSGRSKKRRWRRGADPLWDYPEISPAVNRPTKRRRTAVPAPDVHHVSPNGNRSLWAIQGPGRPRKAVKSGHTQVDMNWPPLDTNGLDARSESFARRSYSRESRTCNKCGLQTSSAELSELGNRELCRLCDDSNQDSAQAQHVEPETHVEASGKSTVSGSENEEEGEEASGIASMYPANTSRRLHTGRRDLYTLEEDILIIKLKEQERLSWDKIAAQLRNRTVSAVTYRYNKNLRHRPSEARKVVEAQCRDGQAQSDHLQGPGSSGEVDTDWNEEKDQQLQKLREVSNLGWAPIASRFPGQTTHSVQQRYRSIIAAGRTMRWQNTASQPAHCANVQENGTSGSKADSGFTDAEDHLIVYLREVEKLDWRDITEHFPGRSVFSIQTHYTWQLGSKLRRKKQAPPSKNSDNVYAATTSEDPQRPDANRGDRSARQQHPMQTLSPDQAQKTSSYQGPPVPQTPLQVLNTPSIVAYSSPGSQDFDPYPAAVTQDLRPGSDEVTTAHEESEDEDDDVDHDESTTGERHHFTQYEDDMILQLREMQRKPWDYIVARLPGRTVTSVSSRYREFLRNPNRTRDQSNAGSTTGPWKALRQRHLEGECVNDAASTPAAAPSTLPYDCGFSTQLSPIPGARNTLSPVHSFESISDRNQTPRNGLASTALQSPIHQTPRPPVRQTADGSTPSRWDDSLGQSVPKQSKSSQHDPSRSVQRSRKIESPLLRQVFDNSLRRQPDPLSHIHKNSLSLASVSPATSDEPVTNNGSTPSRVPQSSTVALYVAVPSNTKEGSTLINSGSQYRPEEVYEDTLLPSPFRSGNASPDRTHIGTPGLSQRPSHLSSQPLQNGPAFGPRKAKSSNHSSTLNDKELRHDQTAALPFNDMTRESSDKTDNLSIRVEQPANVLDQSKRPGTAVQNPNRSARQEEQSRGLAGHKFTTVTKQRRRPRAHTRAYISDSESNEDDWEAPSDDEFTLVRKGGSDKKSRWPRSHAEPSRAAPSHSLTSVELAAAKPGKKGGSDRSTELHQPSQIKSEPGISPVSMDNSVHLVRRSFPSTPAAVKSSSTSLHPMSGKFRTPARQIGTPRTSSSHHLARLKHARVSPRRASTPTNIVVHRSIASIRSADQADIRKRIVETPIRDLGPNDSEDELA